MKIAYAFHRDAGNPEVQSSRPASILRHLREAGQEILEAFPLEGKLPRNTTWKKVLYRLRGQYYRGDRERSYLDSIAREFEERTRGQEFDLVFCPGSKAVSALSTRRPIVFCADATFANMVDYYWDFTNLADDYIAKGHAQERLAVERTALSVYPSQWAADSAISAYGASPEKVAVIPFGANFGADNRQEDVERWIEARSVHQTLRLLFIGRHWERKGGEIVVRTAEWLKERIPDLHVDFVGCTRPRAVADRPWFRFIPMLSPGDPQQRAELTGLFTKAHFVFVPSRAEAYGMTFCEANAFGLPAISTATGGVTQIIRSGVNGYTLPLEADAEEYGQLILRLRQSPDEYRQLALGAFREFETRLNWRVFTRTLLAHPQVVAAQGGPARVNTEPSRSRPALRVAFLENEFLSSQSRRSWSGLPFHMRKAMKEAGLEIVPVTVKETWGGGRWLQFAYWRLARRKRYLRYLNLSLLRSYGRQVDAQLEHLDVDVVFCPSTWLMPYLKTSLPVVLWTDATFANVLDFYRAFTNLAPVSLRDGHAIERMALQRCALAFFSSAWAGRSCVEDYGVPEDRVHVLPFGANIENGVTELELEAVLARRPAGKCRLLFVGVEWERKGAALTVEIVRCLQARGFSVELVIVGCDAPRGFDLPAGVEITGFISKATEEGRQRLDDLFRYSHLFIMPTRADCTPCVYGEANGYALPCIATDVGGVSSMIEAEVNGIALPLDAPAEDYASYIEALMHDRPRYERMCRTALGESKTRLSWRHSAEKMVAILRETLAAEEDSNK